MSRVIGGLTALVALSGIILYVSTHAHRKSILAPLPQESTTSQTAQYIPEPHVDGEELPDSSPKTQELASVDFDWRQVLTNHAVPPRLPHQEVEKYLERNKR